jgi:hypothetical protein
LKHNAPHIFTHWEQEMRPNRLIFFIGSFAMVWAFVSSTGLAQGGEKFKTRLSPVPLGGGVSRNVVDGVGAAQATLSGNTLTITGSFEGLKSAATIAKVHQGITMGARGPAISDLTVTQAPKGTISGTLKLTPQQVEALKKGQLYIQIHSTGAPEGGANLWGWLVK